MATAPPTLAPRHWIYLDASRTHEVHAEIEMSERAVRFLTTEYPAGSRDPAEALQQERRVSGQADLDQHFADLEARLRLTGEYFRADARDMRWRPLGVASPAVPRVDMRAFEVAIPGGNGQKMTFHHFHQPEGEDRLIISMPRADLANTRHALAELSFEFPRVEVGDLELVHARLSDVTLRSTVAGRHIAMPREGFAKLLEPKDYQTAFGSDWASQARGMFDRAASRMAEGPVAPAVPLPPQPLVTRNGEPPPERLPIVMKALAATKVARLKSKFLGDDALAVVRGGEHVIRRTVQSRRRALPHTAAYDLSVLEAVLLLEYAVMNQVWSLVPEESEKLLRFVHGYA